MTKRIRKVVLAILLAVLLAGCAGQEHTSGKSAAFLVTSQHPADYCTALLASREDTIVFVSENVEERNMWKEIAGLGIADLYVISDPEAPFDIPEHIASSVNVHAIDPADGPSASVQIAGMAPGEVDTAFIVDRNAGIEIPAGICSVSAGRGIPILLTDAQALSPAVVQFMQECRGLTQAYVIGDTLEAGVTSDLEGLGVQVYAIQESDAAYINGVVNHALVGDAQKLAIGFTGADMLAAANMCAMDAATALFVPEAIADSQEFYVTMRSFDSITPISREQPELIKLIEIYTGRAAARPFSLKDTGCDGAVFYVPHQDDETLFFSQVIIEAVAEFGAENVYAVLISDGAASNAQRKEPIVGYLNGILDIVSALLKEQGIPLPEADREAAAPLLFSQARTNEYLAALKQLGITNVEIYQYPDGGLPACIPQIKEIISSYEADTEKGKLIHFTYSPYYDVHNDHKAVGQALHDLSCSGSGAIQNVRFIVKNETQYDLEFINESNDCYTAYTSFFADQSGAAQIRAASAEYEKIQCDTEAIARDIVRLMADNGCTIAEAIAQSDAVKQLRLGVGITSVRGYFQALNLRTDRATRITTLHEPFSRGE